MKTFLYCTPSHRVLLEKYLLPSLPLDLDLFIKQGAQDCESGNFMESGWMDSMRQKVAMLVEAIEKNPNENLLHIDADIQFFVPRLAPILARQLESCDLVAQDDNNLGYPIQYCGGFFAFRATPAVRELFLAVLAMMKEQNIHDQKALNNLLPQSNLRTDTLNPELFWSPRKPWNLSQPAVPPACAIVHHANWCVGVKDKLEQLRLGKESYLTRSGTERHGGDYGGKWMAEDSLAPDSVVYSCGIGEDVSFELSLIDRYGVTVHAFDPTPRALEYGGGFAEVESRFHMNDCAVVAGDAKKMNFYLPENPAHVSCSQVERATEHFEVACDSLPNLMKQRQHERIDMLKLDIEGSEYEVLEALLETQTSIPLPEQILVEFHDKFHPSFPARREAIIEKLFEQGYALTMQEGADYSFAKEKPEASQG